MTSRQFASRERVRVCFAFAILWAVTAILWFATEGTILLSVGFSVLSVVAAGLGLWMRSRLHGSSVTF